MRYVGYVALALALASCREATYVTAEISTDADCPSVHGTTIAVGRVEEIERKPAVATTDACGSGRIGSFVVVPSGGDDEAFAIKVVVGIDAPADACVAPDYKGCIVARRAMRFLPHTGLELPIPLRGVCKDIPCTPTTTCVLGTCVDAEIHDPSHCEEPENCGEGLLTGASAASSGAGGAGAGGAGGAGASGGAASCPPDMVSVDPIGGPAYCIDRTEVTRAAYAAFVDAKGGDTSGQPAYCAWNSAYDMAPGCSDGANVCKAPTNCDDHPVVCVDWCDAFAYCAWAKKRLCGAVGGGSLPTASFADPSSSQWFNACSHQGTNAFPYGSVYDGAACNGADHDPAVDETLEVGSLATCEGGFPGVFDMSGNVWEWEDSCLTQNGKNDQCRARGAGFISDITRASGMACARDLTDRRSKTDAWSGIRCCKD